MDLGKIVDSLDGKKVLFVGKTKTMSEEDIELFLEQAGAQKAEDENDAPIGMIVLGRLYNPHEEAMCDAMEREGVPVVDIEKIEAHYAATIDPDSLLGSLTLFRNRERIINLLHNRSIPDELFCEILKLYDWEGKGPFESDENRDVAGTLVARFYPEIERNHNIQYSPLGPFLVAADCADPKLLEAMASIPEYEISQRSIDSWMPRTLHESLLINPSLPASLLQKFAQSDDERKRAFAAMHPGLDPALQRSLAKSESEQILEGLARNPSLVPDLHEKLLESPYSSVRCAFLSHQPLQEEIVEGIERFDEGSLRAIARNRHLSEEKAIRLLNSGRIEILEELAGNESLPPSIYEEIFAKNDIALNRKLAANSALGEDLLRKLVRVRDKELYAALASNPSMPPRDLQNFSKIRDRQIMAALASNPSTPIDILLGYQTDAELNTILKRNEAFGDYIKRNIGM